MTDFVKLYDILGHKFKNQDLLITALSHPSLCYSKQKKCSNYERLELLGDAVLSLIILDLLLKKYPDSNEGELSKRKSYLVCTDALSSIGNKIGIGKYIIMTEGEEKLHGRESPKIIENVMESIIGALYLDGGLEIAKNFVEKNWIELINNQTEFVKDPKTRLQEWAQKHKYNIPEYIVLGQEGSEANPIFEIGAKVGDLPIFSVKAENKKECQIKSAKLLINYIKNNIDSKI